MAKIKPPELTVWPKPQSVVQPKKPRPTVCLQQPKSTVPLEQPEPSVQPKQNTSTSQHTEAPSTTQGHDYPVESLCSDSPVELEGWVRLWEDSSGIPSADISWLKEDTERGLFTPVQIYRDNTGLFKRRRVMKSDRMWFYPPDPPGYIGGVCQLLSHFFGAESLCGALLECGGTP
ncbi:hypothetical protein SRHO_G00329590 [Serrasalmus rhombeus]